MTAKPVKIALLIGMFIFSGGTVFSQFSSRNNYTGAWEDPLSWDPVWPLPEVDVTGVGTDFFINGYITVNSSLSFLIKTVLTINDTLVIRGNLTLGNNADLVLKDKAVLIVLGDLTINNQTIFLANGPMAIMGSVRKSGAEGQGRFTSDINPPRVYIGGSVPERLAENPDYPVLDSVPPFSTTPYRSSGYAYGNMIDVKKDPVNDLITVLCGTVTGSGNDPVCSGDEIKLASTKGASYLWTGPNAFISKDQNPVIPDATPAMAGNYMVNVLEGGCRISDEVKISVISLSAYAGTDKDVTFGIETELEAEPVPEGIGVWSLVSGNGEIADLNSPFSRVTGLNVGENIFQWTVMHLGCESSDQIIISIKDLFVPSIITPNNDGKNDYFEIIPSYPGTELIIFNRWGNKEYANSDYQNNWDGRNNKGIKLPGDTYFYVVKFENGLVRKGTILIKR